ncbi:MULTISPECIES: M15 family metallopeptidase [Nocardioides]|uniref:M15 family metallopeptidase n=1 Tax=Nocardioides TaxID=1839 RepID=UPI002867D86C|nr:M15 family metallopeptidase [Nocardioides sp. CGMCC 1.13656]
MNGRGSVAIAAALLLAVAAGGCEDSSRADQQPAGTRTSATGAAPSTSPTLDPAHAVEPPGRRTGFVGYPDIVVTSADTIDPDTVAAIKHIRHVLDVDQISLADVIVQNQSLRVAAVDPATYRNYTLVGVADSKDVWDRVAAGEIALPKRLTRKLAVDDNGFFPLGSTEDAPRIHIGAYAAQAPLVDAVVNEAWVPDLDMKEGNALLIRTGGAAPSTLRKAIKAAVDGSRSSVQMTDAVARYNLDPAVVQTAVVTGTVADAVGVYRYSVLGGGRIAPDPGWVASHITTEVVPILGAVTCNKLIFPQLKAALQDIQSQGLADEIHPNEYAGCYNARFIAGSTKLSNHAFGLALDLNVPGNQRGTVGQMDRGVVAAFEKWGFTWGGRWGYTDPMHFEMNSVRRPG